MVQRCRVYLAVHRHACTCPWSWVGRGVPSAGGRRRGPGCTEPGACFKQLEWGVPGCQCQQATRSRQMGERLPGAPASELGEPFLQSLYLHFMSRLQRASVGWHVCFVLAANQAQWVECHLAAQPRGVISRMIWEGPEGQLMLH